MVIVTPSRNIYQIDAVIGEDKCELGASSMVSSKF